MKDIHPKKLKNLIEYSDLVVIQWGTERAVPCKRQEFDLDEVCKEFTGIECVKVDIDKYKKYRKQYNVQDIYPAVAIYQYGEPKSFKDSKIGNKTTNVIYGERKNIKAIVKNIANNML